MAKSYRNKPNRDKRNRTRKEKNYEIREVPAHVWKTISSTDRYVSGQKDTYWEERD